MERGFRYQTGEIQEIVVELRAKGCVEVDVIAEDRVDPFLEDLKSQGLIEDTSIPRDREAVSFFDDQNFLIRVYLMDTESDDEEARVYIDFYSDYEEKSYDPIFWG